VLCCVAFDIYTALIPMAGIGSIDVTHPLSSLASLTQLFSVQAESIRRRNQMERMTEVT
jgi:hypothetical protein